MIGVCIARCWGLRADADALDRWKGRVGHREGSFPANYVDVV